MKRQCLPSGVSVSTFVVIAFRRSVYGTELILSVLISKNTSDGKSTIRSYQKKTLRSNLLSTMLLTTLKTIKINSLCTHTHIYNTCFFICHKNINHKGRIIFLIRAFIYYSELCANISLNEKFCLFY